MIRWWKTSFGEAEIRKLAEAVTKEHISQGPVTAEFEERISKALDVPYAVATTSGSAALVLALMSLGIGPGDEVIIPNRTWIATAHAALLVGARVVLADVRSDIPIIGLTEVEEKVSQRTKAVIPVHINGRGVDMEEMAILSKRHGLFIIEDACQALFSRNSCGFLGTQSDIGCFSLGVTKLISTGQGGVAVTRSEKIYERMRLARNHGVVDLFADRWVGFGFNFKFTDLLASFGLVQLDRVPERSAHVVALYRRYEKEIAEVDTLKLIPVNVSNGELPLYVEVLCRERKRLIEFLDSRGIQARPFPPSLNTSDYLGSSGDFPHSRVFGEEGLYLPCGPDQPLENVEPVAGALRDFAQNCKGRSDIDRHFPRRL